MQLSTDHAGEARARAALSTPGTGSGGPANPSAAVDPQAVLPIDVFVHLAHGFDAREWQRRWENGELIGINEPTPYGYGRAEGRVNSLAYSKDRRERSPRRFFRLGLRAILGFDFVHAFDNRKAIALSDVVWVHTESQFLAVALLSKLRSRPRPALIGQSIWLFDRWASLSRIRRCFYAWLVTEVDVLTVHSPDNLAIARRVFPSIRSELVLFGIAADRLTPPRLRNRGEAPLRILAIGNDRHRDWQTAVEAVRGLEGVCLTIVSSTASPSLVDGLENARLGPVPSNEALQALFADCDLVLVPLGRNAHASGITVLQEAAVMGLPAIASDTGGLRAYFGDEEVAYVPVGDATALRAAIAALRDDGDRRLKLAEQAQRRMGPQGLTSQRFVERHLEISRSLTVGAKEAPGPC